MITDTLFGAEVIRANVSARPDIQRVTDQRRWPDGHRLRDDVSLAIRKQCPQFCELTRRQRTGLRNRQSNLMLAFDFSVY